MSLSVLIVDDDPESRSSTAKILEFADYDVSVASSGLEALQRLSEKVPDLVITDVRMPGLSGMEFVEAFQKKGISVPFIVMTAFGQVQDAIWAMKLGATDFLLKPFKMQALLDAVDNVKMRRKPGKTLPSENASNLIGSSLAMQKLRLTIDQVAKTDAGVLILGESGSGKEEVAKRIHEQSRKENSPFVAVNCAAIPENLLESELFGFEKGAFSGAEQAKQGLFEAAHGGTLLLDEIGDMPFSLQPKLLRVLEERKIRRLGATAERTISVRILAATHRDLSLSVKEGKFRQDLLFRLDVMSLVIPPLRERSEDIPELTQFFLKKFGHQYQKNILGIDTEAQAVLLQHSWPGNIRELANVLERAVVLNQTKTISAQDLPPHLLRFGSEKVHSKTSEVVIKLGMSLKEIEDLMIERALHATGGDRARAAKMLGVNERTIYRKISKSKED